MGWRRLVLIEVFDLEMMRVSNITPDSRSFFLSPEQTINAINLNKFTFKRNKTMTELVLTPELQSEIVLFFRHLKALMQHQDLAIFCPFYGNSGSYLLNMIKAPIISMSAACLSKEIDAIINSLKIMEKDLDILQGELCLSEWETSSVQTS
ncbi:uncharacterized protein VP01_2453g4 [Puccinia sorghi]|uniref:Uncharacterized protein n=1 Tax=Puccinia sorghi TaxID=27349 RepID=A0A0L6V6B5_9BASI|nr:uncharacterized protein VP01_2453g4 [Puccinia sorghi]